MNATQTLLVDLVPSQGSSITACVCHSPANFFFCGTAKSELRYRTILCVVLWERVLLQL
jgi:hypothetical protein